MKCLFVCKPLVRSTNMYCTLLSMCGDRLYCLSFAVIQIILQWAVQENPIVNNLLPCYHYITQWQDVLQPLNTDIYLQCSSRHSSINQWLSVFILSAFLCDWTLTTISLIMQMYMPLPIEIIDSLENWKSRNWNSIITRVGSHNCLCDWSILK